MRIAIYSRVSTTEQTVEPQLFALRGYAETRRLEVAETYVDHCPGMNRPFPTAQLPAEDQFFWIVRR